MRTGIAALVFLAVGLLAYLMWGGEAPTDIGQQMHEQIKNAEEWGK